MCRKVAANGLVCVDYQQISVGKHFGGSPCDVLVSDTILQFWVGNALLKTVARRRTGPVRKKHAEGPSAAAVEFRRSGGVSRITRSRSVKDQPKPHTPASSQASSPARGHVSSVSSRSPSEQLKRAVSQRLDHPCEPAQDATYGGVGVVRALVPTEARPRR